MTAPPLHSNITAARFQSVLSQYPTALKRVSEHKASAKKPKDDTETLEETDQWRDRVPGFSRRERWTSYYEPGDVIVDAFTVKKIVRWKLKRGQFRPTIIPLVNSNPDKQIETVVNEALALPFPKQVATDGTDADEDAAVVRLSAMLKVVTKLKGIGPATGVAILSSVYPETIPMFSDEAFRWVMMDDLDASGGAQGWNRKIVYNNKEYFEFFRRVRRLCKRLAPKGIAFDAGDVEKVGWVLGWEAALGTEKEMSPNSSKQKKPIAPTKTKPAKSETPQQPIKTKKSNTVLSTNKNLSKSVTDGSETTATLSKTRAKRKEALAESPPPSHRRRKRNKEE